MARKPKKYDDDDGRTIADMNVEGMPWYVKRSSPTPGSDEKIELSREETFSLMGGVLKAALLVGLVFLGVLGLFILLCDLIIFQ